MPGFDRTGPQGGGSMTGGGRGFCNPAGAQGPLGRGRGFGGGRGFGRGYGPGRGYGRGYGGQDVYPASRGYSGPGYGPQPYSMAPSEEINLLRAETDAIKGSLDEIKRRLAELQKEPQGE